MDALEHRDLIQEATELLIGIVIAYVLSQAHMLFFEIVHIKRFA
jgi:hypothetical protein